jgi:peptide/nickel transport system permease protein
MWKFLLKRFLYMVLTVWVITVISFALIQLPPGDFVTNLVHQMTSIGGTEMTPEHEQQLRELYGLNEPMYVQYYKWIRNIVTRGKFGYSFDLEKDVSELIANRLPMTFSVSFFSFLFVWVVSLPIGIFSAVRQYSILDYVFTFLGFIGLAIPSFLLALICLYVSYKYFGGAPIGLFSPEFADAPWSWARFVDMVKHLIVSSSLDIWWQSHLYSHL